MKANVRAGNHSDALDSIKAFIVLVMNEQFTPGEVVGARNVDALCEIIGGYRFPVQFVKAAAAIGWSVVRAMDRT